MGIGELGVPPHDAAPVGIRVTVYAQVTYLAQSAPSPNENSPFGSEGRGAIFKAPLGVGEGFGERATNLCTW